MDGAAVERLLEVQDGVIARRQALSCGLTDNDIERHLRRREWTVVHPGIYVTHTGPLPWAQRAWAAVLVLQPAALAGASALRLHGLRPTSPTNRLDEPDTDAIHVAVDRHRHVKAPSGVVLVRRSRLEDLALLHLSPPRLRLEEALIDLADAAPRDSDAVAVITDACQRGRSTPTRLLDVVRGRSRLRRRRLLTELLGDVGASVRSVLERRYVRDVERAHGLPTGRRQRRVVTRDGSTYRDVEYREQLTIVELDGRLVHASVDARWADLERDVDAAIAGEVTVRLGWGHVAQPCRTAAAVVALLQSRGWTGTARPCSSGCPLESPVRLPAEGRTRDKRGGSPAAGAGDPPHWQRDVS